MRFQFFCISKPHVKAQRKKTYINISVRVLNLYSCIVSLCNQRILFLITHRYKLSTYSVHAMSILLM